jgi:hypothetical protein
MDKYPGYLGLLKWSLGQTDGTAPTGRTLSEADKAWLKEAFEALTVDEAKRVKELLATLQSEDTEASVDVKLVALDEVEFYVESIDAAKGVGRVP